MTGSSLRGAGSDRFSGALPRLSYRTFKPLEGVEPSPPWFVAKAPDPPAEARKLRKGIEPPRPASEAELRIHRTERELQEGVGPSISPVPGECSTKAELLQRNMDPAGIGPAFPACRAGVLPSWTKSPRWTHRESNSDLSVANAAVSH